MCGVRGFHDAHWAMAFGFSRDVGGLSGGAVSECSCWSLCGVEKFIEGECVRRFQMAYVSLSPPAPRMIVLFSWSTRDLLNGAVASHGKKPAVGTM